MACCCGPSTPSCSNNPNNPVPSSISAQLTLGGAYASNDPGGTGCSISTFPAEVNGTYVLPFSGLVPRSGAQVVVYQDTINGFLVRFAWACNGSIPFPAYGSDGSDRAVFSIARCQDDCFGFVYEYTVENALRQAGWGTTQIPTLTQYLQGTGTPPFTSISDYGNVSFIKQFPKCDSWQTFSENFLWAKFRPTVLVTPLQ